MRRSAFLFWATLCCAISGCGSGDSSPVASPPAAPSVAPQQVQAAPAIKKLQELQEARAGFKSNLKPARGPKDPIPNPPPEVFLKVNYRSPIGELPAYLSPDPKDGGKHPAIVWITGGDCNSIGEVWQDAPASNDQSAAAYRKAGIIMMFPSLRGGNDNPGAKEGFLGEVDDVLAAANHLSNVPYVDQDRIYLGGHSSGGTMVMLTAECSDRFRAVFAFGPTDEIIQYQSYNLLPFDTSNPQELALRSPIRWLHGVHTPLFVFEGTLGNYPSLVAMKRASKNPQIHFLAAKGATHFNILAPVNQLIAAKILKDNAAATELSFTEAELPKEFSNADDEDAPAQKRIVVKPEYFSFCAPAQWKTGRAQGLGNCVVAQGPVEDNFAPSVIYDINKQAGTIENFVDDSIRRLELKQLSRAELQTEAGVKVIKVISDYPNMKPPMKKAFYFILESGRGAFVVGVSTAERFDKLEPLFDAIIKTFKVEPFPEVTLQPVRYVSPNGFSLAFPIGVSVGKEAKNFSAGGIINQEHVSIIGSPRADARSLKDYVDAEEAKNSDMFKVLDRSDFTTDASVTGIRTLVQGVKKTEEKAVLYCFDDGSGTKLQIYCAGPDEMLPVFDLSMKSLKFDEKK